MPVVLTTIPVAVAKLPLLPTVIAPLLVIPPCTTPLAWIPMATDALVPTTLMRPALRMLPLSATPVLTMIPVPETEDTVPLGPLVTLTLLPVTEIQFRAPLLKKLPPETLVQRPLLAAAQQQGSMPPASWSLITARSECGHSR